MTEINVPLLRKAVEWVEEQAKKPEIDREWGQQAWYRKPFAYARYLMQELTDNSRQEFQARIRHYSHLADHCGTTYCVAGYIGQLLDEEYQKGEYHPDTDVHVALFAARELGLVGPDERLSLRELANIPLFKQENTAEDVRREAEKLAGGPL